MCIHLLFATTKGYLYEILPFNDTKDTSRTDRHTSSKMFSLVEMIHYSKLLFMVEIFVTLSCILQPGNLLEIKHFLLKI
jgi:hypothetical protein